MPSTPTSVHFDEECFWVALSDGRTIGVPLAWFPRLLHASPSERAVWSVSPRGIHWEGIDEDISVEGILAGRSDQARAAVGSLGPPLLW